MADRSVRIVLDAKIDGLVNKFRTAKTATADYAKSATAYIQKNEQDLRELSTTIGLVGGAMTLAAGVAVKRWADFDSAMSAVAATGADARQNIEALTDAAIEGGAASVFTATEAASAIEALAKAGVSSADILGGGLSGALDLAAAGGLSLAEAAEIAATSMNQFGLAGSDVPHIADLLAASAGKAMGDVTDMANAFKYVGPVAAQMGISIEETAGSIAFLAQQGVLGDQAGTSLRGMLTSLTSPSKIAADTMAGLGINVYDAEGKFIGLEGVAGQLKTTLSGLSETERDQALGRIFGNEQITTARILYAGGAEAVREWTDAVNESGYAQVTAATKLDNLKGDWEALAGSIETALIGMGEGTDGMLRELVQSVTGLVDGFNELPGPIKTAMLILVGGGGLVALGVAGLMKLAIGVSNTKLALDNLGISGKKAAFSIGGIATVLTIGVTALGAWGNAAAARRAEVDALADSFDRATGAATRLTEQMVVDELAKPKKGPFGIGTEADSALVQGERIGLGLDVLKRAAMGSSEAVATLTDRLAELDRMTPRQFLAEAERLGVTVPELADAQAYLGDMVKGTSEKFGEASKIARQKSEAMGEGAEAAGDMADAEGKAAGATDELAGSMDGLTESTAEADRAMQEAQEQARGIGEAFFDAGDALEGSLSNWGAQLDKQTKALRDFRKNAAQALQKGADEDLVEYLVAQGPAGAAMLEQLADASEKSVDRMSKSWQGGRAELDRFISFQTGVPKEIVSEFKTPGAKDAVAVAADIAAKYDELDGEVIESILRALDYSSEDIAAVMARLNGLDGKEATVSVYAKTSTAYKALTNILTTLNSLPSQKEIGIKVVGGTLPKVATGGRIPAGYARGGRVPGAPPADRSVDNVLAMTQHGNPLAVRSREWIINQQASDKNDAWLRAINDGLVLDDIFGQPASRGHRVEMSAAAVSASRAPERASRLGSQELSGVLALDAEDMTAYFTGIVREVVTELDGHRSDIDNMHAGRTP